MDRPIDPPDLKDVVIDLMARRAAAAVPNPADGAPEFTVSIGDLIEIQTVTLGLVVGALVRHGMWTEPEAVARLAQLANRASTPASAWPFQCLAERIAAGAVEPDGGSADGDEERGEDPAAQ